MYGYDTPEPGYSNPQPEFKPCRPPGAQILETRTRGGVHNYLRSSIDFFKLIFSLSFVETLCMYTYQYAKEIGPQKPSLFRNWSAVIVDDFYVFIAVLMYMGFVQAPTLRTTDQRRHCTIVCGQALVSRRLWLF